VDGYLRLTEDAHHAAAAIKDAVAQTPGLALRGSPDATVFAFGADPEDGRIDTFALGDALADRGGWFFDRQTPPDSLHATVQAGHRAVAGQLRSDLTSAAAELLASGVRADDRSTTYGTV
jgi:glutamate/tyrosine decarboxylase-like PLP-dependent enzyme